MGCAASSDTGTEYVSLGNHGHRHVSNKPKTPTDTQLYGNDHNKRRKSSSSSSSSSSDDEKEKKSKQENNVPPLPPPSPTLTRKQQIEDEQRQRSQLPPIVPIPQIQEQKEDKQPTPPPPQQEDKEPIPPPPVIQEDKKPIPPPPPPQEEDKQPVPVPSAPDEDKLPTPQPPPPKEDKSLPSSPTPDEDKQPMPAPGLEQEKQEVTPLVLPPSLDHQEDQQPPPAPPSQEGEDKTLPPSPVPPPQLDEDKTLIPVPAPPPQEEEDKTHPPTPHSQLGEDKSLPPSPVPPPQQDEDKTLIPVPAPPPQEEEDITLPPTPHSQLGEDKSLESKQQDMDDNNRITVVTGTTGDEDRRKPSEEQKPPEKDKPSAAGYKATEVGTFEKLVNPPSVNKPRRPTPNDGQYYTDRDFTLRDAFPSRGDLEWQRPVEFCGSPALFTDGTTRFDIGQGEVGTCWFLSMVANIADKPELLKRVVPDTGYYIGTDRYDGVFHCNFWRFGDWSDVYIDDFLPVKHGRPVGAHSDTDPNEMWVALLEKAFAKLYGSYEEVTGGQTGDAFMNLTGGVGESVKFDKMKMSAKQLHTRLHNAFKSPTTMVGCVCPQRSNDKYGLVGGHAYSMNGTERVGSNLLVRLRNPWGKTEWTGPWSDGSEEMRTQGSGIPHPNKDDGEFYMHMDHFLSYFEQVTICNITPDVDKDGCPDTLNYITTIFSKWERGNAGGFQNKMENPKFIVTVGDEGADENGDVPIVVQIVQRTTDRQDDKIGIRCDLYKVLSEEGDMIVLDELGDKNNLYQIDMSTSARFRVKPGKYLALPSTMNSCNEDRKVLKDFLIRFFTCGPVQGPEEVKNKTILAGKGPEISIKNGDPISLEYGFSQCIPGRFQKGRNAGGQIGCGEPFASNPQFLINIDTPQRFKVEVMQPSCKTDFPLGIKLFNGNGNDFPADYLFLNRNYGSAIKDLNGDDGAFSYGQCVESGYELQPGTYILLVHANSPDDENTFAVALYSERTPFGVESTHLH